MICLIEHTSVIELGLDDTIRILVSELTIEHAGSSLVHFRFNFLSNVTSTLFATETSIYLQGRQAWAACRDSMTNA
jgi:hypothetical protein